MNLRLLIGIALGFGIGFGCRALDIPVPAPSLLQGALLVLEMTTGYLLADRFLARRIALNADKRGGPSGRSAGRASR